MIAIIGTFEFDAEVIADEIEIKRRTVAALFYGSSLPQALLAVAQKR